MEGADLDPLGVNGGHGGFEVAELLPLLAVKPALTPGFGGGSWLLRSLFAMGRSLARGELSRQMEDDPSRRSKWAGLLKLVKTVLLRTRTTQTMTETTVLDFKLSNTFEEYRAHMNAPEQQAMFAEMGVKTFFIGVCKDDPQRATVMFQGPEDVLYNIFTNLETKPIVEASGHVYEGTVITRWLA